MVWVGIAWHHGGLWGDAENGASGGGKPDPCTSELVLFCFLVAARWFFNEQVLKVSRQCGNSNNKKLLQKNSWGCFLTKLFHWSSKTLLYFVAKGMCFSFQGAAVPVTVLTLLPFFIYILKWFVTKKLWICSCWKPTLLSWYSKQLSGF